MELRMREAILLAGIGFATVPIKREPMTSTDPRVVSAKLPDGLPHVRVPNIFTAVVETSSPTVALWSSVTVWFGFMMMLLPFPGTFPPTQVVGLLQFPDPRVSMVPAVPRVVMIVTELAMLRKFRARALTVYWE
jgi:hypothetical protein